MPIECGCYRLDNGVCRFLSDEQRSRMRMRCWAFLDEEDDVVSLIRFTRPSFVCQVTPPGFQLPRAHSGEDISAGLSYAMVTHSSHSDVPAVSLIIPRPSLIPDLFTAINQGFSTCYGPTPVEGPPLLRLKRSLQLLNAILKELSAVKVPSGIKALGMVR